MSKYKNHVDTTQLLDKLCSYIEWDTGLLRDTILEFMSNVEMENKIDKSDKTFESSARLIVTEYLPAIGVNTSDLSLLERLVDLTNLTFLQDSLVFNDDDQCIISSHKFKH